MVTSWDVWIWGDWRGDLLGDRVGHCQGLEAAKGQSGEKAEAEHCELLVFEFVKSKVNTGPACEC